MANDESVQKMTYILTQLDDYEIQLKKRENATRIMIEKELQMQAKLSSRQQFYKKLLTNMGPKLEEALANLAQSERETAAIDRKLDDMQSKRATLLDQLSEIHSQNKIEVDHVLGELSRLLASSATEVETSKKACDIDEQRTQEVAKFHQSILAETKVILGSVDTKTKFLTEICSKPDECTQQLSRLKDFERTNRLQVKKNEDLVNEILIKKSHHQQSKLELSELVETENRKLETQENSLRKRREQLNNISKRKIDEIVLRHSLASRRVEIELDVEKVDDELRHNSSFLALDKRQANVAKNTLINKQHVISKLKSTISQLKSKLQDFETMQQSARDEKLSLERAFTLARSSVESSVLNFLETQDIEVKQQNKLDETTRLVAQREDEIEMMSAEEKKASTLLVLATAKQGVVRRNIERADQIIRDIDTSISLQELIKLDVSKKMCDAKKKLDGLVSLCEIIRSEKLECTRSIEDANRLLKDLNKKYERLQNHFKDCAAEKEEKVKALESVVESRVASQQKKTATRVEKSKVWSMCQEIEHAVARMDARIEKLKSSLKSLQKDRERRIKENQQLDDQVRLGRIQLSEGKAQLLSLHETLRSYDQILLRGNMELQLKREGKRALVLKVKSFVRS